MGQESRTETLLTRNQLSLAKARAIADGAVERAMFEHLRPPFPEKVWFPNGAVHGWEEDGAKLAVSLAYESGRIDMNVAREPLLKGMFMSAAGLPEADAGRLTDAVMDWRDPDDAKRLNGAEAAEYRAAGRNYVPANANFETIEEVQRVLGMTPEIYAKIADLITVHSRQPGINGAMRGVLMSIPNMTPEIVDPSSSSAKPHESGQPPPPLLRPRYVASAIRRARRDVRMSDGVVFVREVVAQATGN
jgi:general secretion pathway protein K